LKKHVREQGLSMTLCGRDAVSVPTVLSYRDEDKRDVCANCQRLLYWAAANALIREQIRQFDERKVK